MAKTTTKDIRKLPVNRLINGGFDFWQRGTNFSPAGNVYTTDRWAAYECTVAQANTQINNIFFEDSAYKYQCSVTSTAVAFSSFLQRIEGVDNFSGQKAIVAVRLKGSVAGTIVYRGFQNYNSVESNISFGWKEIDVTTDYQTYYLEVDVPDIGAKVIGGGSNMEVAFDFHVTGASETALYTSQGATVSAPTYVGTIDFDWVMMYDARHGEIEFERAGRTKDEEAALCKRYYQKNIPMNSTNFNSTAGFVQVANAGASTEIPGPQFEVEMRTTPVFNTRRILNGAVNQVYRVTDAASIGVTPSGVSANGVGWLILAAGNINLYDYHWEANAEL